MGGLGIQGEPNLDGSGGMSQRGKSKNKKESTVDVELYARLSRLRSEYAQSLDLADGEPLDDLRSNIEQRLREAERLANDASEKSSKTAVEQKEKCLLTVHELEAELCLVKPAALLYPTWIRLRESLYRFRKGRREAWRADIENRFSLGVDEPTSNTLRLRLRQLTLELQEAAARFNRLAIERAAVTREVIKLGMKLVIAFSLLVVIFVTFSSWMMPTGVATLLSLATGISSGGMGAVFSRLQTLRKEKVRHEFEKILKLDMMLRACIGASAALFVVAVLLSESLPFIRIPDERTARITFLVVVGFGAGFSDRLFNVVLSQVIGTRPPHSPRNRS